MKLKENSLNQNIFNQISRKGLIENDKKLLMKKLGFNNLSHSFLTEERNSLNKNYSLIANSLQSLKIDTKKPVKQTSFINININLNNVLKNNLTITNQKSKNKSHIRNFKNHQILYQKIQQK
jgi:signal transduction histidine kinase